LAKPPAAKLANEPMLRGRDEDLPKRSVIVHQRKPREGINPGTGVQNGHPGMDPIKVHG
jgi:hypothetical protein